MEISTFSPEERYWEGGTEPRKKVKRVRSIKVANLDRLRLSMRREKSRYNRAVMASLYDATDPSESSSAGVSGTSSPNYMKATTSSSARKGSLQASSGNLQSSSASSSIDTRISAKQDNSGSSAKSTSKFSKVSVQEYSDPAGVSIPVIINQEKSLKRVPSIKQSKKLSSKKSMKIRAKYSQFQNLGISQTEMLGFGILDYQDNAEINEEGMETDPESSNVSASQSQDSKVKAGAQKRGILERSRSRKLTRLRSIRSSKAKNRLQSRLSGGAIELMSHEAEASSAEPHYMKGTSSHELRKNSDKALTRTSSLRPLRILAKIPSLRSKRNKVRKRQQATSLSGASVDRATCSSTLKRTEFPDDIALEGTSIFHVCPYSYCSIHGHRRHAPSQPIKEFISAKRKLLSNQKGEKTEGRSKEEINHHHTSATETDHLRQIITAETCAVQEVLNATTENAPEAEDNGIDFLIKVYAKPRKKWTVDVKQSKDAEALNGCTYDQISVGDYDERLAETQSETSVSEDLQRALNDDHIEKHEIFKQHQNTTDIAALSLPSNLSHLKNKDSAISPGGGLINIFSDKQKYTSMWQLIHQQLLSSEASMGEAQEVIQADERIVGDGNTGHEMSNLEPNSKCNNLKDEVDDQITTKKKLESHQTAAIKLVQQALTAILQSDAESHHQQSNPTEGLTDRFVRECDSIPTSSTDENLREGGGIDVEEMSSASTENKQKMKQIGSSLLRKEPDGQGMSERRMSKSLSKLRKMFVTAKFIKAMERLKRINPRRPQYLSLDPASENERVYLRHLSMNEKKNTEEWMLDNALRQVISRLDPDQQRRVAQLVEAFETVAPEQEEESNRYHPLKSVCGPGSKIVIPTKKEKQFVQQEQCIPDSFKQVEQQRDGVQEFSKSSLEEQCFREEHDCQTITTGEKTLQELDETCLSDSTLVLSEKSSKSECIDSAIDVRGMGNEEYTNSLNVPFQMPTKNTEVHVASDMPTILVNRQKYMSMWSMIYKHVVSGEASIDENQAVNGFSEEHGETNYCQAMNDKDSTSSDYSLDEDDDNQREEYEKPELDQSAAIKLVKEALGAILKHYEQPAQSQSIPDHYRAPEKDRNLDDALTTSFTDETPIERGKRVENHSCLDTEDNLQHIKNKSLPLQQHVECGEWKAPQRKMSKSLSKLKKAIATTRFIKAMERMTKNSPRKSQNLSSPKTTEEEERVYLRHRSTNGRKKGEEWMLDFALRQVISKMDLDEQRRVERLVEAFEKVHPGQKEGIQCYSLKGETTDGIKLDTPTNESKGRYLKSQQQRSTSDEMVSQKQTNGSLPHTGDASLEISLEEHPDKQASSAETAVRDVPQERRNQREHHDQPMNSSDDIVLQQTEETAISGPTSELSGNGSKLTSLVIEHEEQSIEDETTVKPGDNMTSLLFDKQKYTSMWNLIHQHVLSNEASTPGMKEVNEIDEDEHSNKSSTRETISDPDSTQCTQLKKSKVDNENQSAAFDQSAAINLVREAIDAILRHEQGSDQQFLQDHGRAAKESFDTNALASTKEDYRGIKEENKGNPEQEEKLQEVDFESSQIQLQSEAKKSPRNMSTSLIKLRKAIATAKFIKAMERLRKINPRKPRYLSAEAASEEERVRLRPSSINERKNNEEWMLDYALRKVLSSLAPEQQRKVALIAEAFETMHPEKKDIRHLQNYECDSAIGTESTTDKNLIIESKHNNSPDDDKIPPMHRDRLNMLHKVATSKESKEDDRSTRFSGHQTSVSHKIPDSEDSNLHIHQEASSKGSLISIPLNISTVRREDIATNSKQETPEHGKDPEQDTEINVTKGNFCEKQNTTSMWHLIYQHVKTVSEGEARSKLDEKLTSKGQMTRCGKSADMIADADSDDSDASSVTSELTETDATKLVREAINNILDEREDLGNELNFSNGTAISVEGQRTAAEEKSKERLSRGFSQLRKFIICNKFIKAMENSRKLNPQKQMTRALSSDSKAGKAHLKTRAVGERKAMNEWMLDNVLQNVIAELAPVQQKRVALLVKAFENVHPDLEEKGKGLRCSKTEFPNATLSEEDAKEKEDTVSFTNLKFPDGFDLKLNKTETSSREITTERVPEEVCKDITPGLTQEYALNVGYERSDGPCNITESTPDAIRTLSDICKDPTDIDGADTPCDPLEETIKSRDEAAAQLEEGTSIDEQLAGNNEQASIFSRKPQQPVDLKDDLNYSGQKHRSSEKSASLWGLILQKVTTDMLEKTEIPKGEFEPEAQRDSTESLEKETDDAAQVSSKTKSSRDMGVQTPTSFEFQENEAIKLVEEAVEEILLLDDQISDTESMNSSTTSEQEVYDSDHGYIRESSPNATETAGIATSLYSVVTPEEEILPSKENLPKNHNPLSKVILCKRFIKAMDKMRKLKAVSTHGPLQPPQTEKGGIPSLRQISTSDKTSWEEGMLDNALQKVIGNLDLAKKQRVAMLVKAYETVGSQPKATNSWRGKTLVS